jgi:protein-disulfide isomerase
MSRRDSITLVAVTLVALVLGAWLRWSRLPGVDATGNATVAAVLADRSYPTQGSANANVTLVVFTDYRCPACRISDPEMRKALAADGKVRVIYRDWPIFGARSQHAARLALAANGQGIYPELHEALMRAEGVEKEMVVLAAVTAVGGDKERVQTDLVRNRAAIDAALNQTAQDAFALGFNGTPSYVIGNRVIEGALSERQFRKAFKAAREAIAD